MAQDMNGLHGIGDDEVKDKSEENDLEGVPKKGLLAGLRRL
jgi:hypothetical protein